MLDNRDLKPLRVIDVKSPDGKSSRVSAVYDAAPRKSFVAALKDIPEVWEIPYDPKVEPIHEGYVHDYKMGEGIASRGPFPVRRIELDDYLDDFFFDASYDHLIGSSREGRGQAINLNVRRKIADLELPGHASSRFGNHLGARRKVSARHAQPQGRSGDRDRHEVMEDRQADQDARSRILHAQP